MGGFQVISGTLAGGQRLDKALAEASGLSRERVKALIGEGAVTVAGERLSHSSAKATEGAEFAIVVPPAAEAAAKAQEIPLNVVFEEPREAKFVVSPNAPVRQIWVSAMSRSYKLTWDPERSVFTLGGEALADLLGRLCNEFLTTSS